MSDNPKAYEWSYCRYRCHQLPQQVTIEVGFHFLWRRPLDSSSAFSCVKISERFSLIVEDGCGLFLDREEESFFSSSACAPLPVAATPSESFPRLSVVEPGTSRGSCMRLCRASRRSASYWLRVKNTGQHCTASKLIYLNVFCQLLIFFGSLGINFWFGEIIGFWFGVSTVNTNCIRWSK